MAIFVHLYRDAAVAKPRISHQRHPTSSDQIYERGYRSHEIVPLGSGRYTVRGPMLQGGVFHSKGEARQRINQYMGQSEIIRDQEQPWWARYNMVGGWQGKEHYIGKLKESLAQERDPEERATLQSEIRRAQAQDQAEFIRGQAFRNIGGYVALKWATPPGGGQEEAKSGFLPGSVWSVKCSQHGTVATGSLNEMIKKGNEHAALHETELRM